MRRKELSKDWYLETQTAAVLPMPSRPAPASKAQPLLMNEIPPFRGISRHLLTRLEACEELSKGRPKPCSFSFLDKQIRIGMIYPTPRGRLVMIPIEEIENFNARSQIMYTRRHA